MATDGPLEAFPQLTPRPYVTRQESAGRVRTMPETRRRKSSGLPGEPRGDTGGPSFSTLSDSKAQDRSSAPVARTASEKAKPRSKRRKARTLFRRFRTAALRYTWAPPLVLCLIGLAIYAYNPGPQNPLHAGIFLSYPVPRKLTDDPTAPIQYGKGARDFAFVAFYTIVLSFTREFVMQCLLRPWAVSAGITNRAKQSRFMEQAYTAIYFAIFGPFGLFVMKRSTTWYFDLDAMFEGFPHKTHEAYFKAYYLLQAAYWVQQAVVLLLQLEAPRKDFKELVAHHVVTIALIWNSYRFHFTANAVQTSKVLNYLEHPIVAPYYTFFIFVWIYCRHYLNLRIIYGVCTSFVTVGPFELNWETQQYKCRLSQVITFALLATLQSVNLFWLFFILRIAYRMVRYNIQKDERSDDGEEEEVEGSTEEKRQAMREQGAPEMLLNGEPMTGAIGEQGGNASGVQVNAQNTAKRR
ncbi:hypothetical protein MRB53_039407 [Persea americana]|nr:hypothetical protein MRB53_039407 [Persea americana]